MDRYKGKYRIESARAKWWDYKDAAAYFITICIKDKICYFGEVENADVKLSDAGRIVEQEWLKSPELRPDMNLELGPYVIMPNHFHAIIVIGTNQYNAPADGERGTRRDAMHRVSTTRARTQNSPPVNAFGPQSKNLASIMRGFKSAVTVRTRSIEPDFEWQPLFHDHIIRDDEEFHRISEYILNNPANWEDDKFFRE